MLQISIMETFKRNDNHLFSLRSDGHDLRRKTKTEFSGDGGGDDFDIELRKMLNSGLERVQSVLDVNRALIQQVNQNQQSKNPANLVKNVALICEINGNISKILSIYSDLSAEFTKLVQQHKFVFKNHVYGRKEVVDAVTESYE